MTSDNSIFSFFYEQPHIFFWWGVWLDLLHILKLFFCSFCWVSRVLYIFWLQIFYLFFIKIIRVTITQCQIIFHLHIFGPIYPFLTNPSPILLPAGNNQNVICVLEFQFYIPRMIEIIWLLAFSDWPFT